MPTMDVFEWLLRLEDRTLQGKVVNLGDGAGDTRFGITTRYAAHLVPGEFFTCPTPQAIPMAKDFYKRLYWDKLGLAEVPMPLAASVLSCAVNVGLSETSNFLSVSKGVLPVFQNLWAFYYKGLVVKDSSKERFLDGWLRRVNCVYPELP